MYELLQRLIPNAPSVRSPDPLLTNLMKISSLLCSWLGLLAVTLCFAEEKTVHVSSLVPLAPTTTTISVGEHVGRHGVPAHRQSWGRPLTTTQ